MSERTEKVSEYGGGSLDYIMYEPQPWVHRMMGNGQRFVIEFCFIVRRKSMMRFPWHLSQRWQSYMYKVRLILIIAQTVQTHCSGVVSTLLGS